MPIPFAHPSSIIIAGPSKCGKTVFLRRALAEQLFAPMPTRVVLIWSEWQPEYDKILQVAPRAEFVKGPMPDELYQSFNEKERNLLVLDDQMTTEACGKTDQLEKYFVQGSHHKNLTVVFIVQNLYEKGKVMRTLNLNTNYLVLYKNPRDQSQAGILGRQMYPGKWRAFVAALEKATDSPHSYLLLDFSQDTPDMYRLRSKIFPTDVDSGTDVYIISD